jgi:hypothetical protein
VYNATSGTLVVTLSAGDSGDILADAVQIVRYETAPTTNLTINNFSIVDSGENVGQISVTYTVTGADAPPFSIGIYGSPSTVRQGDLLQSYDVSDPSVLAPGTYTATFTADFSDLGSDKYLFAALDCNDEVYEMTRAGNVSSPTYTVPLAGIDGVFQNPDDGNVYIFTGSGTGNTVAVTPDPTTAGDIDVAVNSNPLQIFSNASNVYVYSPGSGSRITIDPSVTAAVSVYPGSDSTVTGPTENMPEASISADAPTTSEAPAADKTNGDFTLELSQDTTESLTVSYTLSGSTAWEWSDYTLQGAATFAAGTDTTTISVVPMDAGVAGGSKNVVFTLTPGGNYSVDPDNSSATVTIVDNDLPTVSVAADADSDTFTVSTNGTLDEPLLVPYTTGGSAANGVDYQLLSGDVVIPAGSTSATVSVTPLADQSGGDHTVTLTLGSGSGYTLSQSQGTLTIENNQITSQAPSASEFYIGSAGTFLVPAGATTLWLGFHDFQQWNDNWGSVNVTLTWQGCDALPTYCPVYATDCLFYAFAPAGTQTLDYNEDVDVDDYRPPSVTVPAGATGVSITTTGGPWGNLTRNGSHDMSQSGGPGGYDGLPESLTNPSDYVCSALNSQNIVAGSFLEGSLVGMWVPDSERAAVTIGDAVAVEGDREQFTVTLTPPPGAGSGQSYTVNYATQDGTGVNAALAGTDYDATSGTLTFSSSGASSQTITVQTHLDANATGNLNFSMVLSDPGAAQDPPLAGTLQFVNSTGPGLIEEVNEALTIYSPDGSVSEDGVVDVGGSVPMAVVASPAGQNGSYTLSYDTNYFKVTTDTAGNNVLSPGASIALNNGYAPLYLWGAAATPDPNGSQITLAYGVGGAGTNCSAQVQPQGQPGDPPTNGPPSASAKEAVDSTDFPFKYPYASSTRKPDIISSVAAGSGKLTVTITKGPNYHYGLDFLKVMDGTAMDEGNVDRDSAQCAVKWNTSGGVTNSNCQQAGKPAANWRAAKSRNGEDEVVWDTTVPANATSVTIVLIYTDILQGTPAQAEDGNLKGDMPAIIGFWTGTRNAGGNWVFTAKPSAAVPRPTGKHPTVKEIAATVAQVKRVLKDDTGLVLKERTNPKFSTDTGFDIMTK